VTASGEATCPVGPGGAEGCTALGAVAKTRVDASDGCAALGAELTARVTGAGAGVEAFSGRGATTVAGARTGAAVPAATGGDAGSGAGASTGAGGGGGGGGSGAGAATLAFAGAPRLLVVGAGVASGAGAGARAERGCTGCKPINVCFTERVEDGGGAA
jgi:hypothetical protein